MHKFSFCFCSALFATTSAFALTCLNDYSGNGKGCANIAEAAGDCTTLGYSTENVSGCVKWLKCPFDPTYRRCVKTGDGTTCNETSEFAVCQTIDTCKKESSDNCYHCEDGFEYKIGMTGWKQIISENIRPLIFAVKPQLASGTWTLANGITGCRCIARYGCPKTEFPYVISSAEVLSKEDTCEMGDENCQPTQCPNLTVCNNTCTDACGGIYGQITGCVANAEPANGVCQCKAGYYEQNGKCASCEDIQKKYEKALGTTYYVSCIGGTNQCTPKGPECRNSLAHESSYMDGCLSWAYGVKLSSSSGDSSAAEFDKCPGQASCRYLVSQISKTIATHNKNCPNNKVKEPSIICDQYIPSSSINNPAAFQKAHLCRDEL